MSFAPTDSVEKSAVDKVGNYRLIINIKLNFIFQILNCTNLIFTKRRPNHFDVLKMREN